MTTLNTTFPMGVFSAIFSICVHCSEPGATPGQMFTVCE